MPDGFWTETTSVSPRSDTQAGVGSMHGCWPKGWCGKGTQSRWKKREASFATRAASSPAESVAIDRDPLHPGAMGAPQETHDEIRVTNDADEAHTRTRAHG